jgi:hypothetical protein
LPLLEEEAEIRPGQRGGQSEQPALAALVDAVRTAISSDDEDAIPEPRNSRSSDTNPPSPAEILGSTSAISDLEIANQTDAISSQNLSSFYRWRCLVCSNLDVFCENFDAFVRHTQTAHPSKCNGIQYVLTILYFQS